MSESETKFGVNVVWVKKFLAFEWLFLLMAVYYVASKLSFVACKTRCISNRRRKKYSDDKDKSDHEQDDENTWNSKEQVSWWFLQARKLSEGLKVYVCKSNYLLVSNLLIEPSATTDFLVAHRTARANNKCKCKSSQRCLSCSCLLF